MIMSRKIAFFDIDGTIVSDDSRHTILQSTRNAIKKFRDNGNLAFINTGRTYFNIEEFIRSIGFDGYICGCGTHIVMNEKEIFYHTVPKEKCLEIRDILRKADTIPLYERKDTFFVDGQCRKNAAMKSLMAVYRSQGKDIEHDCISDDFSFDKFCIWYDEKSDIDFFNKEVSPDFDIIDRENNFYEVVPKGYSKGTGIEKLLEIIGGDIKDTVAFGDSLNDLPMIEKAALGVCIGSHNLLAPHADLVADEFYDDGLAKVLEKI